MKLAVIGSGNIGKSIGSWAAAAGYEVVFAARDLAHARAAAEFSGQGASALPAGEAVRAADAVLLALPYSEAAGFLKGATDALNGKVLIDATNALLPDYSNLAVGLNTSGAEEIAKLAPGASVVKAFNTIFAPVFASRSPKLAGQAISLFMAGDDDKAKALVRELAGDKFGFDVIDCGPLMAARFVEQMAMLNITLGFSRGFGTAIGFRLLR